MSPHEHSDDGSMLDWLRQQVTPPTSSHVEALAHCIEGWIKALGSAGDAYLVVEFDGRFVQVLVLEGTYVRVEAVGDHYLGGARAYTETEGTTLIRLGWQSADSEFLDHPEIPAEDRSKNYWRAWEPADIPAAAALLALTLTGVLGLTDDTLARVDVTIGCPTVEAMS